MYHEHHQNKDSQVNYQYVTVPCRYMGGEDRGHDKRAMIVLPLLLTGV